MTEKFDIQATPKPQGNPQLEDIDTLDLKRQKALRYEQDTRQRNALVKWVQCMISLWLMAVIFILIGCGRGWLILSDTVLCFFLVTTTFNILGMPYIVLGDLFPGGRHIAEKLAGNKG